MSGSATTVVLSGGGAKAAAHVGALKALAERGVMADRYVATSMGAVIAAAFAAGLGYDEVVRRLLDVRRRDVALVAPGALLGVLGKSFLQEGPLRRTIADLVPVEQFGEMATPLTVTAVDEASGELVLFGDGGREDVSVVDALYASCALPRRARTAAARGSRGAGNRRRKAAVRGGRSGVVRCGCRHGRGRPKG